MKVRRADGSSLFLYSGADIQVVVGKRVARPYRLAGGDFNSLRNTADLFVVDGKFALEARDVLVLGWAHGDLADGSFAEIAL